LSGRALASSGLALASSGRALASSGLALAFSAMAVMGCASGFTDNPDTGHGGGHDSGPMDTGVRDADTGPRPDTGPMPDTGPPHDTGPVIPDMGSRPDASTACGATFCSGLTHCVSGMCTAYPMCRGDGTCPTPGDVCVSLRCVPGTADIDGDGSPASADCDDNDPLRSPLLHEACNMRDDNCNMMVDDGDPATLCMSDPHHGICMMGVCGCPPGTADVDLTVPGCECTVRPPATDGTSCGMPISLGTVFDQPATSGGGAQMLTAMGNADREVWYRFHATDVPDTSCDAYNVHVALSANPGSTYEFEVLRGDCMAAVACPDCTGATCMNFTDYRFAVDVSMGMTGQCPCVTGPNDTVNTCSDDSADYFVRVRHHMGSPATCGQYTLTITNGMP
jgi:hypothetical protein